MLDGRPPEGISADMQYNALGADTPVDSAYHVRRHRTVVKRT